MTQHEQKSESAALDRVKAYLRSRKEKPIRQMGDGIHEVHLGSEYEAALNIPDLMAVVNIVEQRRMDAEGAVAWVDPKFLPSSDYPWTDARLLLKDGTKETIPLYDRPANVAALEARIKELEAALTKLLAVSRTVNRYGAQTGGHWTPFSMELLMASSILNKARGE